MKKIKLLLLVVCMVLGMTACGKAEKEDYKADFSDSVFIGDSVTEGFSFNKILNGSNVSAGAGATAGFALEDMEAIVERAPKRVYILLGQCDLLMPVEDPMKLFINDYTRLIQALQEKLPHTKIYLQSITPVSEPALKEEPRYGQIEEYNQEIKNLAGKLSVDFVDLNAFASQHFKASAEDGIHFTKEFYSLWLAFLSEQEK